MLRQCHSEPPRWPRPLTSPLNHASDGTCCTVFIFAAAPLLKMTNFKLTFEDHEGIKSQRSDQNFAKELKWILKVSSYTRFQSFSFHPGFSPRCQSSTAARQKDDDASQVSPLALTQEACAPLPAGSSLSAQQ